jgi:hypothetical protein
MTAGAANATGAYPPDTVNGRVAHRLHALSQLRLNLAAAAMRHLPAQNRKPG